MARITTQEVGWTNGKTLMYQSCIEDVGTDGHVRRIWASPERTKEAAQRNLIAEVQEWAALVKGAKLKIKKIEGS